MRRLLALVTTYRRGEPWLPTMAERDARWLEVFGETNAARQARNVAARAYAGQSI